MKYQLKKVNIHLPFWIEWTPFKDYVEATGDTGRDRNHDLKLVVS